MPESVKKVDATKVFLLGVILILLVISKPGVSPDPGPGPDPSPVVNVEASARKAMQFTAAHFSEACDFLADEIRDGKITTAKQLLTRSQVLFPAALEQGMGLDHVGGGMTLNELDKKLIPAEWKDQAERARVEKIFREKSRGFGSVK